MLFLFFHQLSSLFCLENTQIISLKIHKSWNKNPHNQTTTPPVWPAGAGATSNATSAAAHVSSSTAVNTVGTLQIYTCYSTATSVTATAAGAGATSNATSAAAHISTFTAVNTVGTFQLYTWFSTATSATYTSTGAATKDGW